MVLGAAMLAIPACALFDPISPPKQTVVTPPLPNLSPQTPTTPAVVVQTPPPVVFPPALSPAPALTTTTSPPASATPDPVQSRASQAVNNARDTVAALAPVAAVADPFTNGLASIGVRGLVEILGSVGLVLQSIAVRKRNYAIRNIDADHPQGAEAATNDTKAKAVIAAVLS